MSATDTIRAMLDERGVEWDCVDTYNGNKRTMWGSVERGAGILGLDVKYSAIEFQKGLRLTISDCSPEQAIEATLGRGECRDLAETPEYRDKTEFKCSECGYEYSAVGGFGCDCGDEPDFRYCPNCGRKVRT